MNISKADIRVMTLTKNESAAQYMYKVTLSGLYWNTVVTDELNGYFIAEWSVRFKCATQNARS